MLDGRLQLRMALVLLLHELFDRDQQRAHLVVKRTQGKRIRQAEQRRIHLFDAIRQGLKGSIGGSLAKVRCHRLLKHVYAALESVPTRPNRANAVFAGQQFHRGARLLEFQPQDIERPLIRSLSQAVNRIGQALDLRPHL